MLSSQCGHLIVTLLLRLLLQKCMFRVALSHEVAAGPMYKNIKTI